MSDMLALGLTIAMYLVSRQINHWGKNNPLISPPIIAMGSIIIILILFDIPYEEYFRGSHPIHLSLGPATVGFALPLYNQRARLVKVFFPLMLALFVGSIVGIFSAVFIGFAFGLPHDILVSLAPKSVTTPIAMGISEKVGGVPALTTAFVMITGMMGAIVAGGILRLFRITDPAVKGFSLGLSSHGLGTFRAFQISEMAGAFAGLAIALNGLLTAIIIPLLLFLIP